MLGTEMNKGKNLLVINW